MTSNSGDRGEVSLAPSEASSQATSPSKRGPNSPPAQAWGGSLTPSGPSHGGASTSHASPPHTNPDDGTLVSTFGEVQSSSDGSAEEGTGLARGKSRGWTFDTPSNRAASSPKRTPPEGETLVSPFAVSADVPADAVQDFVPPDSPVSAEEPGLNGVVPIPTRIDPSRKPNVSVFENELFSDPTQEGEQQQQASGANAANTAKLAEEASPNRMRPPPLLLDPQMANHSFSSPRPNSLHSPNVAMTAQSFSNSRPITPSRLGVLTPQGSLKQSVSLAERRLERIQTGGRIDRNPSPGRGSMRENSFMSGVSNEIMRAQGTLAHSGPLPLLLPTESTNSTNSLAAHGVSASYDPNAGQHEAELMRVRSERQPVPKSPTERPLELADVANFLLTPGPKNRPVFCYIIRDTSAAKMFPKYNLFLEEGKRFLLSSRKRKKQTTTNYIVSLDFDDLGRDSDKFFAKLRANFMGTEFSMYDDGYKPGSKSNRNSSGQVRKEHGACKYAPNVVGSRGPRNMTATIPRVDGSGRPLYKPKSVTDTLQARIKNDTKLDEIVLLRNKLPRWNEQLNAFCLNFNGRVTEASIKNFQLVEEDNEGRVICQFGKIGKNTFTLDYQWPMCALQAFGFALASMDNKLACE